MIKATDAHAPLTKDGDIRPLVAMRANNAPLWLFGGAILLLGILLFNALEARRLRTTTAAVKAQPGTGYQRAAPLPELYVPPDYTLDDRQVSQAHTRAYADRIPVVRPISVVPPARPSSTRPVRPVIAVQQTLQESPPFVMPPQQTLPAPPQPIPVRGPLRPENQERVLAGTLQNPSTTIPQGALIGAVLETALDSTRGGQTRALVTRDVRGFDGSKILLPRGSRLIGEYRADLAPGQNRALVQWTRIIRPDGVTVALNSPAADPLGRAGIKGSVNSHFFERLASAFLSTVVDLGVNSAVRSVTDGPIVVAVPSGARGATQVITNNMQIRPTLKVKQGSRVTVFVARDLDFSSVETQ